MSFVPFVSSESPEIRRLQEHSPPRRLIRSDTFQPAIPAEFPLLDERSISGVKQRAGMELVRREKVGERLIARAVELNDRAQKEVIGELIRGFRVDDMDRVDALAG